METSSNFNESTGWLLETTATAVANNKTLIQDLKFGYDEAGNLLTRGRSMTSETPDSTETFGYDKLDRLKTAQLKIPSAGYDVTESYSYDGLGNLTQKGGKTYTYTGCTTGGGPHAVCTVNGGTRLRCQNFPRILLGRPRTDSGIAADRATAGRNGRWDNGDEAQPSWLDGHGRPGETIFPSSVADGHASPWPPARWARRREGGQSRLGWGVERQGGRESPQGEHFRQLAGPVAQALSADAESVDEGPVLGAEVEFGLFVGRVDKGCGAAIGGGRPAVRVLAQDGGAPHGFPALGLVLCLGLNLPHDAAAMGLALVLGQVQKAGQGSELDVECGFAGTKRSGRGMPGFRQSQGIVAGCPAPASAGGEGFGLQHLLRSEPDLSLGRRRRRHERADGVEDRFELAIVFLFEGGQLAGQVGVR